jgi:acetyl esterase
MPLHPYLQQLLDVAATAGVPTYPEMDSMAVVRAAAMAGNPPPPQPVSVAAVRDVAIPTRGGPLPARIYTPPGPGPHSALVYFHGGGFVALGLDSHDGVCRYLCAGSGSVVVSVDYRLAPEHRFPAAAEDALDATQWRTRPRPWAPIPGAWWWVATALVAAWPPPRQCTCVMPVAPHWLGSCCFTP